jgi:hypothetical protein
MENQNNILTIISCHTNSDIKIRSVIHNIKYFLEISSEIAIINSSEFRSIELEKQIHNKYKNIIINDTLTDDQCCDYKNKYEDINSMNNDELRNHWIHHGKKEGRIISNITHNIYFDYIPNDIYVCHGKWIYYLNKIQYSIFKNIILTNDSFVVTRSLLDFKQLINPDKELVALLESYQYSHHYPDFLRAYNVNGITKLLYYYEKNKKNIRNFYSVIINYEINSSHIFDNIDILYKFPNKECVNIHNDHVYLREYLYKKYYPIVKIKRLTSTCYFNNILPRDFNSEEYKKLNSDLSHFSKKDATNHFLKYGMNEGRLYKKNQVIILPKYLINYMKFIGFDL